MTPTEKRKLLVELIENWVERGLDISPLVGKPLSYFDWTTIRQSVEEYRSESN